MKKKEALLKRAKPIAPIVAKVQEEQGIICSVCQEGYVSKPNELMGVYVFVKKVRIEHDSMNQRTNGY